MALISINGQDSLEGRICTPRTGAWHIDDLVDDQDVLAGAVTVDIDGGNGSPYSMRGTIVRSGVFADTGHVRVVAGAAGLGTSATPRPYQGPSVRTVLSDLLRDAGETLSGTADASILSTGLDAWSTTGTPVCTLISLLLAAAAPGASWRMLADGTLWIGRETWPDAGIDSALYQIFEDSAESGTMLIGVDAPLFIVGTTFEGRRVSYTEANAGQQGHGVEMRLWFEDAAVDDVDRMKKSLGSIVRRAAARSDRVDYGRMYPATIVSQSGSTVDVQPDLVGGKALLPDMAGVELLFGSPGISADGTTGKVRIGWHGGDPSRPFAVAFEPGSIAKIMILDAIQQLLIGGQGAPLALVGAPHQAAEAALYQEIGGIATTAAGATLDAGAAAFFTSLAAALSSYAAAAQAANNYLSTKVGIAP